MSFRDPRFIFLFLFFRSVLSGAGSENDICDENEWVSISPSTNCVLSLFSGTTFRDEEYERSLALSNDKTASSWIDGEKETAGCNWNLMHLKCLGGGCLFRCSETEARWLLSPTNVPDGGRAITMKTADPTRTLQSLYTFREYPPKTRPTTTTVAKPPSDSLDWISKKDDSATRGNQETAALRVERINHIPFGTQHDRLADYALNDPFGMVREAAVVKLLDQSVLAEVAAKEPESYIRAEAVRRISNRKLLRKYLDDKSLLVRRAAEEAIRLSLFLNESSQGK